MVGGKCAVPEILIVIAIIIGSMLFCWVFTSTPDDEDNKEDKSDEDNVLVKFLNEHNKDEEDNDGK